MLAIVEISAWHWVGFIVAILFFLALDLGVFHRHAHVIKFKEALGWTAIWFTLSMLFAAGLAKWRGAEEAKYFVTGYILELSLSMDNVFVIALIFGYFRIPLAYQHRVLFWGILGALIMRGLMIWLGIELINRFHWMIYVFGAFLLLTGIKMLFSKEEEVHPEKNPVIRLTQRFFPVSHSLEGQKFTTQINGKVALTPLALVLVMVETTDLIFAIDSIPAILGVTQEPFIVFTSNVFAILGLRSLYFVLANALDYFRYLKIGLSLVLAFIGAKMLLHRTSFKISTDAALLIVAGVIIISVIASLIARQFEHRRQANGE